MSHPGPRPLSVLVVDDDSDAAESTAAILDRHGYSTRVALSGAAAILEADAGPDVAILDLHMPGVDGWQVARRLRGRPDGGRLLVVAVSGYGDDDARRRSGDAGVDLHLVKPVEPADLLGILERFHRPPASSALAVYAP